MVSVVNRRCIAGERRTLHKFCAYGKVLMRDGLLNALPQQAMPSCVHRGAKRD